MSMDRLVDPKQVDIVYETDEPVQYAADGAIGLETLLGGTRLGRLP